MLIIISNDNNRIEVPFDFCTSVEFARSFNDRQWDGAEKVWRVNLPAGDIQDEIEQERLLVEIREYLNELNSSFGGTVYAPTSYRGQSVLYTEKSLPRLASLLAEADWEILQENVLMDVNDFYYHRI